MLKDGDKLCFATKHFDIQAAGLDVIHNAGNHLIGMAAIIAYTADTDGSDLPSIAIFNFGNGYMKFVADTAYDGLYHHSLTLESFILRNPQVDFTDTDIHRL
jgi:hypothetical protein